MVEFRRKTKEAEGENNPIGRPAVSSNPEPRELPETEAPTRSIHWSVPGPWHI